MCKTEIDKTYFVAFCIEQYKQYVGKDGAVVADQFFTKGVSQYLYDNYDVLHTQGRQWLMEEIDSFLCNGKAS